MMRRFDSRSSTAVPRNFVNLANRVDLGSLLDERDEVSDRGAELLSKLDRSMT
jgi:hypothetical protein